ncbi:MAG: AbrB/MazE/SpoVT family DNA-binding domain-containing protein [bacterium]
MKATGITRKIDQLGRVVVPKELRKNLNWREEDKLEIFVSENQMVFKKYQAGCHYCNEVLDLVTYKDKSICPKCLEEISKLSS